MPKAMKDREIQSGDVFIQPSEIARDKHFVIVTIKSSGNWVKLHLSDLSFSIYSDPELHYALEEYEYVGNIKESFTGLKLGVIEYAKQSGIAK